MKEYRLRKKENQKLAQPQQIEEKPKVYADDEDSEIYAVPLKNEACRAFREMMLHLRDKDPLWASQHHMNCSACMVWWSEVYHPTNLAIDLWASGI